MSEYGIHQLTVGEHDGYSFAICNPCGWSVLDGRDTYEEAFADFLHHVKSSPLMSRIGVEAQVESKEFAFNPQIPGHLLLRAGAQFFGLSLNEMIKASGADKTRARRLCIYVLNLCFDLSLSKIAQMLDLSVGHAGNIKNGVARKLRTSPELSQEIEELYLYMAEMSGNEMATAEEA